MQVARQGCGAPSPNTAQMSCFAFCISSVAYRFCIFIALSLFEVFFFHVLFRPLLHANSTGRWNFPKSRDPSIIDLAVEACLFWRVASGELLPPIVLNVAWSSALARLNPRLSIAAIHAGATVRRQPRGDRSVAERKHVLCIQQVV